MDKLIMELLESINTMQIMEEVLQKTLAVDNQLPQGLKDKIAEAIKGELKEFLVELIPIYKNAFTEEDIRGLIAFYNTPIGKKSIAVLPQVTVEAMQVGSKRFGELADRVAAEYLKGDTAKKDTITFN